MSVRRAIPSPAGAADRGAVCPLLRFAGGRTERRTRRRARRRLSIRPADSPRCQPARGPRRCETACRSFPRERVQSDGVPAGHWATRLLPDTARRGTFRLGRLGSFDLALRGGLPPAAGDSPRSVGRPHHPSSTQLDRSRGLFQPVSARGPTRLSGARPAKRPAGHHSKRHQRRGRAAAESGQSPTAAATLPGPRS